MHPVFYDTQYIFWFIVGYMRVDLKSAGTALPTRLGSYTFQKNNCTLPVREKNNHTTKKIFHIKTLTIVHAANPVQMRDCMQQIVCCVVAANY